VKIQEYFDDENRLPGAVLTSWQIKDGGQPIIWKSL